MKPAEEIYINGLIEAERLEQIAGMLYPVRCTHCTKVYDLCATEPIHRYTDCTTFRTPCCGVLADDRTWKSRPDFRSLP